MSKGLKILLSIAVPLLLIAAMAGVLYSSNTADKTDYSEIVKMIDRDEISEIELNMYEGKLTYKKRDDDKKEYTMTVVSDVF